MVCNSRYTNCEVNRSRMWFPTVPLCNTATCPEVQKVPTRCPMCPRTTRAAGFPHSLLPWSHQAPETETAISGFCRMGLGGSAGPVRCNITQDITQDNRMQSKMSCVAVQHCLDRKGKKFRVSPGSDAYCLLFTNFWGLRIFITCLPFGTPLVHSGPRLCTPLVSGNTSQKKVLQCPLELLLCHNDRDFSDLSISDLTDQSPTYPASPPLAPARPMSQKNRQNSGSTPTPCLDPLPACSTHDGKHT